MDDLDTSDDDSDSDDDDLSLEAVSVDDDGDEDRREEEERREEGQVEEESEEEEETAEVFFEPDTHAISNRPSTSSSRPSIMRLGNHSTPQLAPSPSWLGEPLPPFDADPRKPIGHVTERPTYFSSRVHKGGKTAFPPLPPFDPSILNRTYSRESVDKGNASDSSAARSYRRSRSSSRPSARRATTSSSVPDKDKPRPSPRESILRFDDMLMGHIASEREAIKRITDNISSMSNSEAGTSFLPL